MTQMQFKQLKVNALEPCHRPGLHMCTSTHHQQNKNTTFIPRPHKDQTSKENKKTKLGIEIEEFDRAAEPPATKTAITPLFLLGF